MIATPFILAAKSLRLIPLFAVLCLMALASPAHAYCMTNPDELNPLTNGTLDADDSVPNGAALGQLHQWTITLTCNKGTNGKPIPETVQFTNSLGVMPGTDLWASSLTGIGLRVTVNGTVISANRSFNFQHPGDGSQIVYNMTLQMIKTGPVRPSNFTTDVFGLDTTSASEGGHNIGHERIVDTLFEGVACTVANDSKQRTVNMGTWSVSNFNGVGSSVGRQRVSLNMRCNSYGTPIPTPLSISLDGTTVDGHDNLLQVTGEPAASGIGIRLTQPDTGAPLPLNEWIKVTNGATAGSRSIDMNADYYQYADKVTPGGANGIITFRIDMR
jgi:type 1 fimbria pilin